MKRRPWFPGRRSGSDPGPEWAVRALAPLLELRSETDVTPIVMARVRAAAGRAAPRPGRAPRTLQSAAFAFGAAGAAALLATVVVLYTSGDEGARAVLTTAATLGQAAVRLWEGAASAVWTLLSAAGPILHALLDVAHVAAPLLRGLLAAVALAGLLSILLSLFVFARARLGAPGIPFQGGVR